MGGTRVYEVSLPAAVCAGSDASRFVVDARPVVDVTHTEATMKAPLTMAVIACAVAMISCGDDDPSAPALTPLTFNVALSGDNNRPTPVDVPASGTGSFTVTTGNSPFFDPASQDRKIVTYSLSVAEMSGSAVEVNIHGPADDNTAAGILVPLTVTSTDTIGLISNGTFTTTTDPAVSMDSLVSLLRSGNAYVSVRTAAFPEGEIRGQIQTLGSGLIAAPDRRIR